MPARRVGAALLPICAVLSGAPGCGLSSHGELRNESETEPGDLDVPGYDGPRLSQTPGPLALDELADAYEELLCEALIRCAGRPYRGVSHCRGDIEAQGLADLLDGVAEGRINYDADAMGACRRVIERNLCAVHSLFLFTPSVPEIVQLCAGTATTGTQAEGEPCRGPLECGRDLYCEDEASCPGVCRTRRTQGAPCARKEQCQPAGDIPELSLGDMLAGGEALSDELYRLGTECFLDTCRHVSLPGADCSGLRGCAGDLTYCDFARGECVARGGEGHACSVDGDECARGHFCDIADDAESETDGTCRPIGTEGDPCRTASECKDGLRCIPRSSGDRGRCAPPSASGEPCARNSDCAQDMVCDDGACAELPQAGSRCLSGPCAGGAICEGGECRLVLPGDACDRVCFGLCRDGICQARLELGERCSTFNDCQSRACEDDVCVDGELCEAR